MSDNEQWGVGNQANAAPFGTTWIGGSPLLREEPLHPVHLITGEHPHSRSDNSHYARDPQDGEILAFSGHRYLYSVIVDSYNYVKESEYSGDEIRKGCICRLFVNGNAFYEMDGRDPVHSLLGAASKLQGFGEGPEGLYYLDAIATGQPNSLIGRRVYWRDSPAVITSVIPEQGCLILEADGIDRFPPDAYELEAIQKGEDPDDWGEEKRSVKTLADSKDIHWWRDAPTTQKGNGANADALTAGT